MITRERAWSSLNRFIQLIADLTLCSADTNANISAQHIKKAVIIHFEKLKLHEL